MRGICRSTRSTANGPALDELLQPRLAVAGGDHVVALGGEDLAAALADAQLVVDDEDARLRRAGCAASGIAHPRSSFTRARNAGGRHRLVEEGLGVHGREVLGAARTEVEALLARHGGHDDDGDAGEARDRLEGARKGEARVERVHHEVGDDERRDAPRPRPAASAARASRDSVKQPHRGSRRPARMRRSISRKSRSSSTSKISAPRRAPAPLSRRACSARLQRPVHHGEEQLRVHGLLQQGVHGQPRPVGLDAEGDGVVHGGDHDQRDALGVFGVAKLAGHVEAVARASPSPCRG